MNTATKTTIVIILSMIFSYSYPFAIRYCADRLDTNDPVTDETWVRITYNTAEKEARAYLLPKKGWVGELHRGDEPVRVTIEYLDQLNSGWERLYKNIYEFHYDRYGGGREVAPEKVAKLPARSLGKLELLVNSKDSILLKEECSVKVTPENSALRSCRLIAYRLPEHIDTGEGYTCLKDISGEVLASTEPVALPYRTTLTPEEEQKRLKKRERAQRSEDFSKLEKLLSSIFK